MCTTSEETVKNILDQSIDWVLKTVDLVAEYAYDDDKSSMYKALEETVEALCKTDKKLTVSQKIVGKLADDENLVSLADYSALKDVFDGSLKINENKLNPKKHPKYLEFLQKVNETLNTSQDGRSKMRGSKWHDSKNLKFGREKHNVAPYSELVLAVQNDFPSDEDSISMALPSIDLPALKAGSISESDEDMDSADFTDYEDSLTLAVPCTSLTAVKNESSLEHDDNVDAGDFADCEDGSSVASPSPSLSSLKNEIIMEFGDDKVDSSNPLDNENSINIVLSSSPYSYASGSGSIVEFVVNFNLSENSSCADFSSPCPSVQKDESIVELDDNMDCVDIADDENLSCVVCSPPCLSVPKAGSIVESEDGMNPADSSGDRNLCMALSPFSSSVPKAKSTLELDGNVDFADGKSLSYVTLPSSPSPVLKEENTHESVENIDLVGSMNDEDSLSVIFSPSSSDRKNEGILKTCDSNGSADSGRKALKTFKPGVAQMNAEDPAVSETNSTSKNSAPRDEISNYGDLIASRLRKFDDLTRTVLMRQLDTILFNAEVEKYSSFRRISGDNHAGH